MKRIKPDDPKQIELMNFLIERTKDAKWPLRIKDLADEYMRKKGWSQSQYPHLTSRITCLLQSVGKSRAIDIATKVKMMFALSAGVSWKLLKELRKNAYVDLDEYHRIIKYSANDGSLSLEGEHTSSIKSKARKEARAFNAFNRSRIPEFMKRAAVELPDSSTKLPRIVNVKPWTNVPPEPRREPPNSKIQELREPGAPEVPKAAPEPSGVDALIIKFLKMIQSLILSLGIPQSQLTEIHRKIQQKIQKIDGIPIKNNEVTLALGQLIALVLELLVTRIVSHSVRNIPENQISVSLKRFLCYLRAAILDSSLEGLENVLKKIEENINAPDLNDKYIPVEKMTEALQDTLTNVGF